MTRNAFGDYVISPERLTRRDRVDALRRLAGHLLADQKIDAQWLGAVLTRWLQQGGRLEALLGVTAARGSHATPQAQARTAQIDSFLLQLSTQAGGDKKALRMLRGEMPCTDGCADLIHTLRTLKSPVSQDAIRRARHRRARHKP